MTTPEKTNRPRLRWIAIRKAYTLFEVLLALGIIAVLLGVTVPLVTSSWSPSPSEAVVREIEKSVQATHSKAVETGEARRIRLLESGLQSEGGLPSTELPKGWKLQVRRFTENRFRKPQKVEFWGFNGAGICDPLELRLVGKDESIVLKFDPLTALILSDEN
jgi:prepilin-type N-terminal cleavage/methylation domain-containing protein